MKTQDYVFGGIVAAALAFAVYLHFHQQPEASPPAVPPPPAKPSPKFRLVIVSQEGCSACVRLKSELKDKTPPFGVTWVEWSRRGPWKVSAVPTLVKVSLSSATEVSRREGYLSYAELLAWMEATP